MFICFASSWASEQILIIYETWSFKPESFPNVFDPDELINVFSKILNTFVSKTHTRNASLKNNAVGDETAASSKLASAFFNLHVNAFENFPFFCQTWFV